MAGRAPNPRLARIDAVRDHIPPLYWADARGALDQGATVLFPSQMDARRHDAWRARYLLELPACSPAPRASCIADSVAEHTASYSHLFGTLANPYGAMPSMHTGWSVWVAVMLGTYVWRSWWARLTLALHPTLTIVTIVATGNHYVVDAIAGFAYFLIAWLCVTLTRRTLLKNVRSTGETS